MKARGFVLDLLDAGPIPIERGVWVEPLDSPCETCGGEIPPGEGVSVTGYKEGEAEEFILCSECCPDE